jgi:hypothetical protein
MIPSLRLVEDIPDWGMLAELVGGEHHGANVLLVPATRLLPRARAWEENEHPPRRRVRLTHDRFVHLQDSHKVEADRRAEALLVSLLDPGQRSDWETRRRFWVDTAYGAVELGRVSDLRFDTHDGRHFTLCVVPQGISNLPDADVWTNLLLVLRAEPERFFDVANYCTPGGRWRAGPVPRVQPRPLRDPTVLVGPTPRGPSRRAVTQGAAAES